MEIKRFDDFIICPIPAESELDQVEIEKIVAHTRNTWQHDRQNGEMRENTIQGKRAEIVIENILNDNSTSRFLAYDKIREIILINMRRLMELFIERILVQIYCNQQLIRLIMM